jgi:hypothetical protein
MIRRRILVNFRIAPEVMQRQLPGRFRPKLHAGKAIGGICLIRLEHIRPLGMPAFLGLNSENAAHRIAVFWEDEHGVTKEGVFIPRRDTDSKLNQLAGGRVFPGEHHAAQFHVEADGERINLEMKSKDGEVAVRGLGVWDAGRGFEVFRTWLAGLFSHGGRRTAGRSYLEDKNMESGCSGSGAGVFELLRRRNEVSKG